MRGSLERWLLRSANLGCVAVNSRAIRRSSWPQIKPSSKKPSSSLNLTFIRCRRNKPGSEITSTLERVAGVPYYRCTHFIQRYVLYHSFHQVVVVHLVIHSTNLWTVSLTFYFTMRLPMWSLGGRNKGGRADRVPDLRAEGSRNSRELRVAAG